MAPQTLIRALVFVVACPIAAAAQDPPLETVLKRASDYLAAFQRQLSTIVAEETYEQHVFKSDINNRAPVSNRRLRSDLMLMRPPGGDRYVEFRDVFEVDGRPVRDRQERLTRLFADPSAAADAQIGAIVKESARYNLGAIVRTVNTPLMPMMFLDPAYQRRFKFKRSKTAAPMPGARPQETSEMSPVFRVVTEMWTIEYDEKQKGTVIKTPQGRDLPARGRFWINPATGAVLMTQLVIAGDEVKATVTVSYQSEPLMGFLVPVEMRERYASHQDVIEGTAVYGRFRSLK